MIVTRPWERVNQDPYRDANPFFHLMEAIAMLAPYNSVPFLSFFAKNMANFSDDGRTYNAFYGTRIFLTWHNQLRSVIDLLKKDPDSRQAVVSLWDPEDLRTQTKDKACNLMLLFSVDECGSLSMTSFNRSNDAIWGILTGANVVHLSMFQEYVALCLGREIGPWTHVSNNLHVYTNNPKWPGLATQQDPEYLVIYQSSLGTLWDTKSEAGGEDFRRNCWSLCESLEHCISENSTFRGKTRYRFLSETVIPMFNAYVFHKNGYSRDALHIASEIQDASWRLACESWLQRRIKP